jgi:PKD repeat protein
VSGETGGSTLGPLDLVYVCGNKFLATNATPATVQLEYRVVGTNETGSITLRPGVAEGDQSWSETELETQNRGTVELYRDDQRVARRRNEAMACGAAVFSAPLASLGEAESGSWSAPIPWPVVAIHLHLLPNGKVLSWGRAGDTQLWDPETGRFTAVPVGPDLFCSGHSFTHSGMLMVSGGHISDDHGLPNITVYNASLQTWGASTPMRRGRWYPTNTSLPTGDVLILGGRDEAGLDVAEPEVWSANGNIRVLSTASLVLPYYPRTFLAPNGQVFYAGESQTTRYLNTAGTGSWTTVGGRLYGTRDYGSAVMYDLGKILYVGGGRTTNTAEIINLNSAAPKWQWTGSMAFPRRHLNATVLPTGEVLATGGTGGTTFNDLTQAVHAAEIWNPSTGAWRQLASNAVDRGYHATSILLPDGRVLHSGSGGIAGSPDQLNAELFSPPYLFKGPHPRMTDAPNLVGYNIPFRVQTPEYASISKVSLIRLGSVTHAFDMNQRFQELTFTRDAGGLIVTAPTAWVRTPGGHYMLFILDANGVPSVARIVKVGAQSSQPAATANAAPVADFSVSCTGLTCDFTDGSIDSDGNVTDWSWSFGDNATATTRNPSRTFPGAGTYTVTLAVTDNKGGIDQHSVPVTISADGPPNTPPSAAFTHSCTNLACTFTDASSDTDGTVTARSWDFGDNTIDTTRNPMHTFASGGTYTVSLVATDDDGATATASKAITVTPPAPNAAPKAWFVVYCNVLRCRISDLSTDADGSVVGLQWTFGDGTTLTDTPNLNHDYPAPGTYTVTLRATDDDGATGQASRTFAITSAISLNVTGQVSGGQQQVTVTWSGATGSTVDLYLNRGLQGQEANDGLYTASRPLPGMRKYTYNVCQRGSVTLCSNEATKLF